MAATNPLVCLVQPPGEDIADAVELDTLPSWCTDDQLAEITNLIWMIKTLLADFIKALQGMRTILHNQVNQAETLYNKLFTTPDCLFPAVATNQDALNKGIWFHGTLSANLNKLMEVLKEIMTELQQIHDTCPPLNESQSMKTMHGTYLAICSASALADGSTSQIRQLSVLLLTIASQAGLRIESVM